jgi:hypothetical protein
MSATSLLLGIGGASVGGTVALLAQAAPDPSSVAPYVGGGVGVIAVGALAEVLRRLLNGTLIPRQVKDFHDELGAAIVASGQREAESMREREAMRREREEMVRHAEDLTRTGEELRAEVVRLVRIIEDKR